MKMMKQRIELIDIMKAAAIFMVLWGHTALNSESPYYRIVIYSFHMPLFFFLSGMSLTPKALKGWQEWKGFLIRNWLILMVPYLLWGMIYCQSSYESYPVLFYASWEAVNDINTLTSLWFLPCLFVARILVQIVIDRLEKLGETGRNIGYYSAAVLFFIIGRVLPHGAYGWPFCFDVALVAAAYISVGIALKKKILSLAQQKADILGMFFILFTFLFWFGTFHRGDELAMLDMCRVRYGSTFWVLYNIIFGSSMLIIGAMLFQKAAHKGDYKLLLSVTNYIGTRTMGIFLVHKPLMQTFVHPFIRNLLPAGTSSALVGFLTAIIMVPICCLLCHWIECSIPQLFGRFRLK